MTGLAPNMTPLTLSELKPYDKNFGALSHWLTSNGWRGVTPKRGSILIIYDKKTGNEVKRL